MMEMKSSVMSRCGYQNGRSTQNLIQKFINFKVHNTLIFAVQMLRSLFCFVQQSRFNVRLFELIFLLNLLISK